MRSGLVWIASAVLLGGACAASAKVESYNGRARLVQDQHHRGADRGAENSLFTTSAAGEECRVQEPSKLGLLRSTTGRAGKSKVLCRKLKT